MQYHSSPLPFTKDQVEKIGNTIIYLAERVPDLDKGKILQSLFLLEECSWKKYLLPFFDIQFQLWKTGPVAKDIYIDLSEDEPHILSGFIKRFKIEPPYFLAANTFHSDQFSDNDLTILKSVTGYVKDKDAETLLQHNTGHHSLWYLTALHHGVLDLLLNGPIHATNIIVDFAFLFCHDADRLNAYHAVTEEREFIRQHKP